ncbi:MAG: tripartite tricarboxylate transporter substrate binding protein [Betaproteobacteria bacterium]|nr:tripartite tricarboxylate transporter substrate binding protein [Betaproteobacteria bacterium]
MKAVSRLTIVVLALAAVPCAFAQNYPSKPIKLISPYPPGGGTDAAARIIAQALGDQMGQQVVVDTRGGASGLIGTELAAKSAPDGYTIVLGNVAPLAILPAATPKLPYDPLRDFSPISLVALSDYVLTVHPSLPVKNIKELLALAKANPDKLTYASSGNLGAPHLAGELLNLLGNVKTVHIPYKGNGPAAIAVMSGESTMLFGTGPSVVPHAHTGKLRMLATTGPKRTIEGLPAMNELLPGYDVTQWYGLLLPAGAPKEIVERLNKEIARALATPKIRDLYIALGTQPLANSPEEFATFIRNEKDKWAKVIKTANIKADF